MEMAAQLAGAGDAVVLSPGCASFDWYSSYAQRGEHFSALVKARLAGNAKDNEGNAKENEGNTNSNNYKDSTAAIDKSGEVGEK